MCKHKSRFALILVFGCSIGCTNEPAQKKSASAPVMQVVAEEKSAVIRFQEPSMKLQMLCRNLDWQKPLSPKS